MAEQVDQTANTEESETPTTTPDLICTGEELPVRSAAGLDRTRIALLQRDQMVTAVDKIEEYRPNDPGGHILWRKVILEDGTTGWAPSPYLVDRNALAALDNIETTARLGDAAALAATVQAFIDNAAVGELGYQARYCQSPDERHLVLATGDHITYTGFLITVGKGVVGEAPLRKHGELGLWLDGSRYWAGPSVGSFDVYDCRTLEVVCVADMWWTSREYLEDARLLLWLGEMHEDEIDYSLVDGPTTEPAAAADRNNQDPLNCMKLFNFADGVTRVIAAPDLTTLVPADWNEDFYVSVVLKPTAAFAADPFFDTVSSSEFYQHNIGRPNKAYPSVE